MHGKFKKTNPFACKDHKSETVIKIIIADYRDRAYDILSLYKTQLALIDSRYGWLTLKRKRSERFGVFSLEDAGNFYNF